MADPNTIATYTLPDPRNVPKDYYKNVPTADPHVADLIKQYIADKGLKANQNDPSALHDITSYLRDQGINAQTDYTDVNNHTGGILVNGRPYQLIDGSNNWTPLRPWEEGDTSGSGAYGPGGGATATNVSSQLPATLPGRYMNPQTGQLYTPSTPNTIAPYLPE